MEAKQPKLPPLGDTAAEVVGMQIPSAASRSFLGAEDSPAALRAELNRARDEFHVGDYTTAPELLERLLARLDLVDQRGPGARTDRGQVGLLGAVAWSVLGRARERLRQQPEAYDAYSQAVSRYDRTRDQGPSDHGEDNVDIGRALKSVGRHTDAIESLRRGLSLRLSAHAEAEGAGLLGAILAGMPDTAAHLEAERLVRHALELLPDDPDAHAALARTLEAQGRVAEAASSYFDAAGSLVRAGRLDEAHTRIDSAVDLAPSDGQLLTGKGEILRLLGRYQEGLEVLDHVIAQSPDLVDAYVIKAEILRTLGLDEAAIPVLQRALEIDPNNVDALGTWAQVLHAVGRHEEALTALTLVTTRAPELAWGHAESGRVLADLSRYEEASVALNRAWAIAPNDPWVALSLSNVLSNLGHVDEAMAAIDRALMLLSGTARGTAAEMALLRTKALLLAHLDQHARSLAVLDELLRLSPNDVWVLRFKAVILTGLDRLEEAVDALSSAAVVEPTADVHAEIGGLLRELGRNDEALGVLDRALALAPDDTYALTTKAEVLRDLGRNAEAVAALEQAARLAPEHGFVHSELAELLFHEGRYDEALKAVDHAIRLLPDSGFDNGLSGLILRELKRYDEAEAALRRALELDSSLPWIHAELGELLRVLDRNDEAMAALNRALELDPDSSGALSSKGALLLSMGLHEQALESLDEALKRVPDDAFALGTKGDVLRLMGHYEQALEVVDRAAELAPNTSWIQAVRGSTLHSLDRPQEAREALNRALEEEPNYSFAIAAFAELMCDIAEYEQALEVLARGRNATSLDPWVLTSEGWAYSHIQRATEARRAYAAFSDQEPTDPEGPKGVGNALRALGNQQEAVSYYERAIALASERVDAGETEYDGLLGWCYTCLGRYDEAIRCIMRDLSRYLSTIPNFLISRQFDLALAFLLSGRHRHALQEYERGLTLSTSKRPLLQRGHLHVALFDLEIAARVDSNLPAAVVSTCMESLLRARLDLALTLVTGGWPSEALVEVERGLDFARRVQFPRQQQLCRYALDTWQQAITSTPGLSEHQAVQQAMQLFQGVLTYNSTDHTE